MNNREHITTLASLEERVAKLEETISVDSKVLNNPELIEKPDLSERDIDNICLTYRHDFGLLPLIEQDGLRFKCKEWYYSILKNAPPPELPPDDGLLTIAYMKGKADQSQEVSALWAEIKRRGECMERLFHWINGIGRDAFAKWFDADGKVNPPDLTPPEQKACEGRVMKQRPLLDLIMQEICEAEYSNPDNDRTVCLNYDDIYKRIESRIKNYKPKLIAQRDQSILSLQATVDEQRELLERVAFIFGEAEQGIEFQIIATINDSLSKDEQEMGS